MKLLGFCTCEECLAGGEKGAAEKIKAIIIMMAWQLSLYGAREHAKQAAASDN